MGTGLRFGSDVEQALDEDIGERTRVPATRQESGRRVDALYHARMLSHSEDEKDCSAQLET